VLVICIYVKTSLTVNLCCRVLLTDDRPTQATATAHSNDARVTDERLSSHSSGTHAGRTKESSSSSLMLTVFPFCGRSLHAKCVYFIIIIVISFYLAIVFFRLFMAKNMFLGFLVGLRH